MHDHLGDHTTIVRFLDIVQKQESTGRRPHEELLLDTVSRTETRGVLLGVYKYHQKGVDHQFKHDLINIVIKIQDAVGNNITHINSKNSSENKPIQNKSQ